MLRQAKVWGFFVSIVLFTTLFSRHHGEAQTSIGPGPCQVGRETVTQGGLEIDIYVPQDPCTAELAAPYPAVAFAHGFSFFGLSDGASDNASNGMHLASWGYVVAVPELPDDAQMRFETIIQTLDLLSSANEEASSFLYHQVDLARFAVAGHSLGGATALAAAARDPRVQAVVALDPVYHARTITGSEYPVWDPAAEGPAITVPTAILGAPGDPCNSQADFEDIYPFVGSTHKATYHIINASHCVFADPGNAGCDWVCGGNPGPELTRLSQKYMTAWLNYYLHGQPENFDQLYGSGADADVSAGTIKYLSTTAPQNFTASRLPGGIKLQWALYEQAMIAGYHIYRRLPGQPFSDKPFVSTGLRSSYIDTQVSEGEVYIYKLLSTDPAGNLHQASEEVLAVPQGGSFQMWMPFVKAS
jgi:dienelactone hydrolase